MYVCVRVRVSEYVCVRVGVLVHVLQKCTYHPTSQWLAPAAAGATLAWHTRSHSHSSPFSLCWGPKGAPVGCVGVGVGVVTPACMLVFVYAYMCECGCMHILVYTSDARAS